MYAQKFNVNVVIRGEARACPLDWLDQFCMRNFTNSADFDDTLPVADGKVEASFRLSPERFAEGLAAWLTQRGKGQGARNQRASDGSGASSRPTRSIGTGQATRRSCWNRLPRHGLDALGCSPGTACAASKRGGSRPSRKSPSIRSRESGQCRSRRQ